MVEGFLGIDVLGFLDSFFRVARVSGFLGLGLVRLFFILGGIGGSRVWLVKGWEL